MGKNTKAKVGLIIGVSLIAVTAAMMGIPFAESNASIQDIPKKSMEQYQGAEDQMLEFIAKEKESLESKIEAQAGFP